MMYFLTSITSNFQFQTVLTVLSWFQGVQEQPNRVYVSRTKKKQNPKAWHHDSWDITNIAHIWCTVHTTGSDPPLVSTSTILWKIVRFFRISQCTQKSKKGTWREKSRTFLEGEWPLTPFKGTSYMYLIFILDPHLQLALLVQGTIATCISPLDMPLTFIPPCT